MDGVDEAVTREAVCAFHRVQHYQNLENTSTDEPQAVELLNAYQA
jgi:hypothetical protein